MSLVKLTKAVQDRIRHLDVLLDQLEHATTSAIRQLGDHPDVGFVIFSQGLPATGIAYLQGSSCPLKATRTIEIPPLCTAVIPHDTTIETDSVILLIPEPAVIERGLFVNVCLQPSGVVVTRVFNVTGQMVRIRKGEVISSLVAL